MRAFLSFFILLLSLLESYECATVVVDGVSQWKDPIANIGDTIIFKHKYNYNVYIFRTKEAFNSCNFTQATQLSNPNSPTYTWHPSRPGNFYFSFYNGTTTPCHSGQKLSITIPIPTPATHSPPSPSPENPVIPPPATPGGVVSSSPVYPWPFQPREDSPGPISGAGGEITTAPAMAPMTMPGSIPFINSNPAVPLPTGEVDSATIRPLPTSANHAIKGGKMVGLVEGLLLVCFVTMVIF